MQPFKSALQAALLIVWCIPMMVTAHSWVEQLMVIAPNGTMIGQPGYARNNLLRTSPTFSDTGMVWLIPPDGAPINQIDANQMMCRPEQTTQTQSSGSPRLQAAPGQSVSLRYQENGHVTLPQNQPGKPVGSGGNFVYFTNDSTPNDKFLQIHRQWTPDGRGGDARGRLLSTQNFDDGQCYQVNDGTISEQRQVQFKHQADNLQGANLWCQQDIQIPADAEPGSTITLYWVWDWPTMPGTAGFPQGKQEIYTTCMDIDIIAPSTPGKLVAQGFIKQDFGNAAVSSQFANIANPTAIKAQTIPFSSAGGTSASTVTSPSPISNTPSTSIASTQPAISSTTPTAAETPDEVTVTVQATVTATTFSTQSRKGTQLASLAPIAPFPMLNSSIATPPTVTVTDFQTDLVTVFVTGTATATGNPSLKSKSTDPLIISTGSSSILTTSVINMPPPAQSTSLKSSCSTTAPAFRLRARNPFYIVPVQDQPGSTAGSGC